MQGMWWGMALGLALGGSLHCMGMCGGFALMANAGAGKIGLRWPFVAYLAGKTLGYAVLGLAVGSLGAAFTLFRSGGMVLAWVAGLAMLAVGAHLLGWRGFGWVSGPVASRRFVSRMAGLITQDSLTARFAMGLLNGWLPCGLVYAALPMAAGQQSFNQSPSEALSVRELEVFEMTGHGLGTREIANRLNLSIKTVESYRARIKMKLNLNNAAELVQHAVQWSESSSSY